GAVHSIAHLSLPARLALNAATVSRITLPPVGGLTAFRTSGMIAPAVQVRRPMPPLSTRQKIALIMITDYVDFELELGPGDPSSGWPVSVVQSPAGNAREVLHLPAAPDQLA